MAVSKLGLGLLLLAWWPWFHDLPAQALQWHWSVWAWLAGLGVFHTGLAYALMYAGMQRLEAGRIAVLQFVYPISAIVLDWAVYGRALSLVQLSRQRLYRLLHRLETLFETGDFSDLLRRALSIDRRHHYRCRRWFMRRAILTLFGFNFLADRVDHCHCDCMGFVQIAVQQHAIE